MRHRILYADQLWRSRRWVVVFVLMYSVSFNFYILYVNHFRLAITNLLYLGFVLLAFLMFATFQINRQRSYVVVQEDGVRVGRLLRTYTIPYSLIRSVRVQPLKSIMQEMPRRWVTPVMKQLQEQPALVIRLQGEPADVSSLAKKLNPPLGHRLVFESTAAIPVADAADVVGELSSHVQARVTSPNLGGKKRPKRRR